MDKTERKITKIAREAETFTVRALRADGVGTAEMDFIHTLRHHPGMTQADMRRLLNLDKGGAARRVMSLEAKGYLTQERDPADGRRRWLFATERAEQLKNSKASVEGLFYGWLTECLTEEEEAVFLPLLDRLYQRAKRESRAGFPALCRRLAEEGNDDADEE